MNIATIGIALALVSAGVQTWRLSEAHAAHDKAVAAWSTERTTLANDRADAIEARNTAERAKSADNLENANEQARLKEDGNRRVAALAGANRGLHDTIAALNAGHLPGDPGAAGSADAAAAARRLVGECADELASVGGAAHGLRNQVTGLQRYVSEVCLAHQD